MNNIKVAFKSWRRGRNLTQAEAGEMVGASRNTILRFESGTSIPRGDVLQRIYKLVEMPETEGVQRTSGKAWKSTTACPTCSTDVPGPMSGATACLWCGHRFGIRCMSCDHVCSPGDKFCSGCGNGLTADS